MTALDLLEFGPAHIFYISLIISAVLFAEAGYVLFAGNDSARKRSGRSLEELYLDYYVEREGVEPDARLMDTFREVMEEAGYAST